MPLINSSNFNPPFLFRNGHVQTVIPTLFRKVGGVNYLRQRIETPDSDFLDLDISSAAESVSAAVICHGLEGSSDRAYMRGMAGAFNSIGADAVCYNYRGCSGEMNRNLRMYNAGATDDLSSVISSVFEMKNYESVYLVGFSLGANLVLRYAGEQSDLIDSRIKGLVAVSAPCDLTSSSVEIHRPVNFIYQKRFLRMMLEKLKVKKRDHNELAHIDPEAIKTLRDFDDLITAPVHGYRDAAEYWLRASSRPVLSDIRIPALILSALDDPILGKECYPFDEAAGSGNLFLEAPERGGHVGFMTSLKDSQYWHEKRTIEFIQAHCL